MKIGNLIHKRWSFARLILLAAALALIAGAPADTFPEVIPLPNGFQPEGIAIGNGSTFYVGSIPTGAVYRGDLATGEGSVLVPAQSGHQSIGLKVDERTGLLYVAGGPTGKAFVYDAGTGANVASIQLTGDASTFINDVAVTKGAVYFTDPFRPVLYRLPLGDNGALPDAPASEEIPLGGDFVFVPGAFNTNGIAAAANGKALIIVSSAQAALYRVDPNTGAALKIDLGGSSVPNGDGILLHGKRLYVVQNFLNQIAVVRMDASFLSGTIERTITSPHFPRPDHDRAFSAARCMP